MTEQAPDRAPGDGPPPRPAQASAPPGYSTVRTPDLAAAAPTSPPPPTRPVNPVSQVTPVYGRVVRFGVPGVAGGPHPVEASAAWPAPVAPPAPTDVSTEGPQSTSQPLAWPAPLPWTAASPPYAVPPSPLGRRTDLAPWSRRVLGRLLDDAPSLVAAIVLQIAYLPLYVGLLRGDPTAQPTWSLYVVGLVLALAAFVWTVYNRWVLAGRTGQSVGRKATGTWLVSAVDGRPVGTLNAFVRDLLHVLDSLGYVGYLWPLWDDERQTLADKVARTVVVSTPVAPLSELERSRPA